MPDKVPGQRPVSGTVTGCGPRKGTLGQKLVYEIGEAACCRGEHMTVDWEAVAFNLSVGTYQLCDLG